MGNKNIATITKEEALKCLEISGILFPDDKPEDYILRERWFDKKEFKEEYIGLEGTVIFYEELGNNSKEDIPSEKHFKKTDFRKEYLDLERTIILNGDDKENDKNRIIRENDKNINITCMKLEDRHARYFIFKKNEILTRPTSSPNATPIPNLFTIAEYLKGKGYDIG